jgi:hypothetical protein
VPTEVTVDLREQQRATLTTQSQTIVSLQLALEDTKRQVAELVKDNEFVQEINKKLSAEKKLLVKEVKANRAQPQSLAPSP